MRAPAGSPNAWIFGVLTLLRGRRPLGGGWGELARDAWLALKRGLRGPPMPYGVARSMPPGGRGTVKQESGQWTGVTMRLENHLVGDPR